MSDFRSELNWYGESCCVQVIPASLLDEFQSTPNSKVVAAYNCLALSEMIFFDKYPSWIPTIIKQNTKTNNQQLEKLYFRHFKYFLFPEKNCLND